MKQVWQLDYIIANQKISTDLNKTQANSKFSISDVPKQLVGQHR